MLSDNISKEFNDKGLVHLQNIMSDHEIKLLKEFTFQNLKINNDKSFFLTSKSNDSIKNFYNDNPTIYNKIREIILELSRKLNLKDYNTREIYSVLRVLKNERIKKESYNFHFDAHIITLLVPIIIPNRENSDNGHLLISPNLRNKTNSIFKNIFQKFFYQSFLKMFKRSKILSKILKLNKIILKPGSLLLFNGFRSLHGNLEINKSDTRATLLIHFYDQFQNSKLVKLNREMRIKKEKQIIKENSQNG